MFFKNLLILQNEMTIVSTVSNKTRFL